MNEKRTARWLSAARRYCIFFLLMSFTVSCCMLLFLTTMQQSMGVPLERNHIDLAARLTFGNVMLISLLCTAIDAVRRWYLVERPVRRITEAAEQLMHGDLSARILPLRGIDAQSDFNTIIEQFNRMAQELSGIETLRTDFIADVSHELKTPLAVIRNYCALLGQPELPEPQRMEYARALSEAARGLTQLITNILKLSKLENQRIYPEAQAFDLSEQLCACLLAFEQVWEENEIQLETEIDEGVRVESDAELLALVWNNLFSNAFKFTPPGGRISVGLAERDGRVFVRVADTGCGISREAGAHIFEKFYQADPSRATRGNGLGLALVKRVMDIVGGEISVHSEVGKGSEFTVALPGGAP